MLMTAKKKLKLGFWNLKTMSQYSKKEQVIKQVIQYKIDIRALLEVRRTGMGQKRIGKDHIIQYRCTNTTRD